MGPLGRRVGDFGGKVTVTCPIQRYFLPWLLFLIVLAGFDPAWAVKRHSLFSIQSSNDESITSAAGRTQHAALSADTQGGGGGHTVAAQQPQHEPSPAPATVQQGQHAATPPAQLPAKEPAAGPSPSIDPRSRTPHELKPSKPAESSHMPGIQRHEIVPQKTAVDAEPEVTIVHDKEHVVLPQLAATPGVTFVETMIRLLEDELDGRILGWRPNDVLLGRLTDNVNNYQLGVLEAMRFTTMRLKDSLTRMGDADTYDPDLEAALNLLMNRASLFWFPSAETSYGEAVAHLKKFLVKLQARQRQFYYRTDNLQLLVSSYKDLLGNVNRNLIRTPIGWFKCDDYFYYAKGVAHVYYEILKVVRVGFYSQLATTLDAVDIMDEILHELHRAEQMDPWVVLDSSPNSLFANHRADLNAPLSEVVHLLGVLAQF